MNNMKNQIKSNLKKKPHTHIKKQTNSLRVRTRIQRLVMMKRLSWDVIFTDFNLIVRWSYLTDKRRDHWYTRVYTLVSRIIHCCNTAMLIFVVDTNQISMTYVTNFLLPDNDSSLIYPTWKSYSCINIDFNSKWHELCLQYLIDDQAFSIKSMSWPCMCGRPLPE